MLTNSNTHAGGTEVNGGLLRIDNAGALGSGNLSFSGGGIIGLGAGNLTDRTVGTGDNQVQWTGSGGFAAFGANRTVSFGTPGTSVNWTAANFIGAGRTLILSHATADATLVWDQTTNLAGGTRTVQVNDGAAAIDARITRSINGGSSGTTNNVLNKSGAGTLALTANSFYFGNTTVSAGTLMIGAGATLVFADSASEDWTGGALNITGDFTNTSIKFATSDGLDAGQLAVISVNGDGTGTYTLDASGYLVPGGGGSPYDTWAGGPGLPIDGDANGDGVSNGLAFLLGAADKDENAINRLPTVSQSGGNLVLDFDCLPLPARGGVTFKVEHSANLAGWTATTNVVPDETNVVPDHNVTFEVQAGPVGPPALNSVQATIGSAAAGGGGKLFGRLKAEKP